MGRLGGRVEWARIVPRVFFDEGGRGVSNIPPGTKAAGGMRR